MPSSVKQVGIPIEAKYDTIFSIAAIAVSSILLFSIPQTFCPKRAKRSGFSK
jgi:hypothetical protein